MLTFRVDGEPVPQPRPRVAHGRAYVPKSHPIHAYRQAVAILAKVQWGKGVLSGPVGVDMEFVLERPRRLVWKSRPMVAQWHTGKPDSDNLAKAVLDSMLGVVIEDDDQVCRLSVIKRYAAGGELPGVLVKVFDLAKVAA